MWTSPWEDGKSVWRVSTGLAVDDHQKELQFYGISPSHSIPRAMLQLRTSVKEQSDYIQQEHLFNYSALAWCCLISYVTFATMFICRNRNGSDCKQFWQLSCSRTGCIMFVVRQLHFEQIYRNVVTATLTAPNTYRQTHLSLVTVTGLIRISYVALTVAYLFLICNRTGRDGKAENYWELKGRGGTDPT